MDDRYLPIAYIALAALGAICSSLIMLTVELHNLALCGAR